MIVIRVKPIGKIKFLKEIVGWEPFKMVKIKTMIKTTKGTKTTPILPTFSLLNKLEIPKPARTLNAKLAKTKILVFEDAEIAGILELKIALAKGVGRANIRAINIRVRKYFTSIFPQLFIVPIIASINTITPEYPAFSV